MVNKTIFIIMEPYIGQIILFAGTYAPLQWEICDGRLLPIAQYEALFTIIGTTFGGDGQTHFALPDLRGRAPVGPGQGPGLSNYEYGQVGGANSVTLGANNLPPHTHQVAMNAAISTGNGSVNTPNSAIPANSPSQNIYHAPGATSGMMGGVSASADPAGGSLPVDIQQPYLAMYYVICTEGIYPSRS